MGRIVVSLLIMSWFAPRWTAPQTQRGAAGSPQAIHACALLTKELVTEHSPLSKESLNLAIQIPPMENAVGQSGSECDYGGVTLTIDAFTPEYFEKQRTPAWTPVT